MVEPDLLCAFRGSCGFYRYMNTIISMKYVVRNRMIVDQIARRRMFHIVQSQVKVFLQRFFLMQVARSMLQGCLYISLTRAW